MKTRSTSRLTSQHEKEIPRAHRASDSFLKAGPRTRSASHKLPTFKKSTSESSDLVSEKVVKNTFKTPEKDGITPERDGILPSFSGTEKLSQTTKITHKQTEENSQSLKDYGILPDNSVLGFTKPDDSFWWKHLDKSFQPSFQHTGEGILLGKDSHLGDSTIKNMSPLWYKHISSSLLATPAVRRVDGTVKNSSANISNEEESYESPSGDLAKKLFRNKRHTHANPFQKIMDTHDSSLEQTLHNSDGSAKKSNHGQKHKMSIKNNILLKEDENRNSSDTDISFKLPRPHKLFKGIKNKALVNKDLFRKALQDTMDSSEENNIDLQSRISVKTTKRLPDKDSDEDISIELQNPTRLFKRRKTKALINKDLFQMALQNTSNSPNDVVNDQRSIMPEPSTKHLSSSDISDEDISLKASRPNKLFKGRKAKTLVNKDLFQMALQNTSNSPNDAVNDLQSTSTMPEPSAKHLSGSDISDEDISLKASRPNKLFKGRKAKTLVNKDLFQKALRNTTNSPNNAVNDLQSIIPEPSAKHLSGSDISDEDISLKASRPNKLFKGRKAKTLVNKDLFREALQNTTNSPNDAVNDLQSIIPEPSAKHLSGSDISDEDISLKASRPNKLFKGRKAKTLVNKDLFQKALQNTSNSPNDVVNDLQSIIPEPSAKHLSGSDISDEDISLKASRPNKLFKGRKAKTLVNKDLFREALQNTTNSPNDAVNDLQSIIPEPSAKHLSGSDISDEDISFKASRSNKLFKGKQVKRLVNKDLFQKALQNTTNTPNDTVIELLRKSDDTSSKHLSDSDIIDKEISLKASRPTKLFKGRKAKTLVNKDLFREALQNTSNIPNDAINDLQSIIPEPSTKHFLGSDISDDDIPLKALCPNKLFKGRKAKTLVNKDLFREALQITSYSPNNALNDQKSIIPEPSTKYLSGSDISEGDISIKASRPKKLFKGSKTQTLTNKDLFQKALQNTTKSSDDTIKNVEARKLTKSTQKSPNINKIAEEISLETLHQNTVFMERKTQTLVNKDLIRQNLQSSPMNSIDVINDAQSGPADKSTHHLNNSEKQSCDGNFTNSTKAVLYNKSLVPVIEKLSQNSIAMLTSASPAKRDTTQKISSENYAIDSEIIQSPLGSEKLKRYPRSSDPSLAALKNKKSLHLRKKLNFSKVNTSLDQSRTDDSTTSLIKPTTPKLNTKPPNSALQNDLSENKKELLQHSGGNNKMTITSSSVGHISNIDNAISIEKKRTPIKSGTSKVTLGSRNNENESGMVLNENSEHSQEFEMHLDANKKKTRNIVGDTSKRVEEKSRTLLNEQESRTSLNKSKELSHNIHSTKKSNQMDMVKNTKFSEDLTPYDNFSPHITKVMSSTRLTPSFSERETNQSQTANKVLQLSEHNAQTKVKINTIVSQENESSDTHNDLLEKSYLQSFPSNEKTMESPVRSLSSTKSKGKATHEGKTSLKNSEINSVLTDEVLSKSSTGSGQSNISKEDSVKVKSTSRSGENAKENFHYLSENVKQKSNAIKFSRTKKSSKHADELIGMDSGNTKNIDSFSELGDNELNAKSKRLGNSLKDIGKTMALLHGEEESSDSNRESTAHNQTSESVQKTRLSKTEALNRSPDLAAILTNVHKENSGIDDEQSLQFAKKDLISEKSLKHLEKPFKGTISHNSRDESIVVTKQIQKTYVFESSDHEESLKRLKKSLFIDNTNSVTSNKSLGTQLSTKHVRKALFADTDKLLQNVENFSLVHKNRENMDIDKESRESISLTISNSNKGNSGETLNPSQSTLLKRRAAIKAVIQRVKEKMARNICMDTEISNSTTTKQFPNYFSHALKINDLTTKPAVKKIEQKSVNPDFLVNGQVYRAPRLAKPARWVTPRLYNLLVKKCELKYGRLKARRKAEGFVLGLYEGVKIVLRRKSGLEMYVKRMQKDLFQLGIIESLHDFYQFVREYLPEQFRYKVVYCTRAFGKTSGIPYGPNTNIYAKLRFN